MRCTQITRNPAGGSPGTTAAAARTPSGTFAPHPSMTPDVRPTQDKRTFAWKYGYKRARDGKTTRVRQGATATRKLPLHTMWNLPEPTARARYESPVRDLAIPRKTSSNIGQMTMHIFHQIIMFDHKVDPTSTAFQVSFQKCRHEPDHSLPYVSRSIKKGANCDGFVRVGRELKHSRLHPREHLRLLSSWPACRLC